MLGAARRSIWVVVLLSVSSAAQAQERLNFDLLPFHPASTAGGLFNLEGTEIGAHLKPQIGLQLSYLRDPLVYESAAKQLEGVSTRINADLFFSMGFFNRGELGVDIPLVLYQAGDAASTAPAPSSAGIGDIRLAPKVRVFGNGVVGLSLSVISGVRLPTGRYNSLAGGGWAFEPQALLGFRWRGLSLHASAGYRLQEERSLFNLVVDDQLLFGLGARYRWGALSALAEITAATAATSPFGSKQQTPVLAMAGLAYTHAGFRFSAGGGPGVVPGYGSPAAQVMFSIGYAPGGIDTDGDGIPDDKDVCPLEREDRDGFEDADGCPDPDNDRDGIPDVVDKCPNEAEDLDGFEDEDGCPDRDNDKDGIPDLFDKCPNEAEDKDGFEDTDGCPDPDNDLDGFVDKDDRCPNEAGTRTGAGDSEVNDGCPKRKAVAENNDRDGDGIPNDKDQCPDEPETFNGYQDDDGCPDEPTPRVEFKKDILWTSEAIYFGTDSWVIKARFRPIMKKVAEAIVGNKRIHVVYVEGHADERGTQNYNQWLSFYRAEEVVLLLRKLGVERTRLRAMGWGAERPSDPNSSEKSWARNRRVIFHVEYRTPRSRPNDDIPAMTTPAVAPATKPTEARR
jgi:outer membrane protein OmpA-like peptidoglycan-associated protein